MLCFALNSYSETKIKSFLFTTKTRSFYFFVVISFRHTGNASIALNFQASEQSDSGISPTL
jgi:hypothetical protein